MRLIDTASLELKEFISDDAIPSYAILSHTWETEEVTLQDMRSRGSNLGVTSMKGYRKIEHCCREALQNGLLWAWVDTCCIDKTSSAELSEAINSMYRWYQNAAVCYVFLSDLTVATYESGCLSGCRWFTRGWTLQELIAPEDAVFFSAEWKRVSTKALLQDDLEIITGVPKAFLLGVADVAEASIAMRMSWAAGRDTSRTEDLAYCLLGLFDINLPLIYGEGKKAFRRLQEELIRTKPYEHTIYAWGSYSVYDHSSPIKEPAGLEELGVDPISLPLRTTIQWDATAAEEPLLGLLAESPSDFLGCGHFVPSQEAQTLFTRPHQADASPPRFLHEGIAIAFRPLLIGRPVAVHHLRWPPIIQLRKLCYAGLLVRDSSLAEHNQVTIPLIDWNHRALGRRRGGIICIGRVELGIMMHVFAAPMKSRKFLHHEWQSGDIIFRWDMRGFYKTGAHMTTSRYGSAGWRNLSGEQAFVQDGPTQVAIKRQSQGFVASWTFKPKDKDRFWYVVLHRVPDQRRTEVGALAISIVRCLADVRDQPPAENVDGHVWHHPWHLPGQDYESVQAKACCSCIMRRDVEVWRPVADGLPAGIAFCVEIMRDPNRGVEVDVVDFRFPDGEGDRHVRVPRID